MADEKNQIIVEKQKINPNVIIICVVALVLVGLVVVGFRDSNSLEKNELLRQERIDICISKTLSNTKKIIEMDCNIGEIPTTNAEEFVKFAGYCKEIIGEPKFSRIVENSRKNIERCIQRYK